MKKKILFILALVSIVLFKSVTYAATCTDNDRKALKTEANNMVIKTQLRIVENPGLAELQYGYDLNVINASKNFIYKVGEFEYNASKINSEGNLEIPGAFSNGGYTDTVQIIANNKTKCNGTVIKTFNVWLPRYNKWYSREECKGLESYPICKKTGNTSKIESEKDFLNEIKKAKKDQEENKKPEEKPAPKKSNIEKIKKFFSDYKIELIAGIVLITVVIVIIIKVREEKEKKKIKINIKELGGDK